MLRNVVSDSRSGHFEDILGFAAAVFHLVGVVRVNASRAANAVSDDNADSVGIFANVVTRVGKRLARRLNAEKRRAVIVLVGKLLRGKMRLRAEICIAPVSAERFYLFDTRNSVHSAVPALGNVVAERAAKSKTRNDNASFVNIAHQKTSVFLNAFGQ